jgi:hypothetical protein
MSNWLSSNSNGRQGAYRSKGKRLPAFFLPAVILAIAGTGFVLFILHLQGINPLEVKPRVPVGKLPAFFSPSVRYWEPEILAWSEIWDLDPLLVTTVMQIESCGDPKAESPAGAQGLFQVMPFHFAAGEKMQNPDINAQRGLAYLSESYQKSGGNIELTLAGYNGGHGQIDRQPALWPEETQHYVQWGSGIYWEAVAGDQESETLKAWLMAGGWHLCQQAERSLGLR